MRVAQVDVAHLRLLIPVKHRVNGLGKLGTAGLIDTNSTCSTEFTEAIVNGLISVSVENAVHYR